MNRLLLPLLLASSALALSGCDVEQTEEGEAPDVDVEAEGGNLPEYDVDAPDVDVGTEERTITVPDVEVNPPEEEGEVSSEERDPEDPPDDR